MFSVPLQPGESRGERLGELEGRSIKHILRSRGFSTARQFSQTLPSFSPGYEGTENMFYFFYKIIIFRLYKKKGNIRSAYIYYRLSFNMFHETLNSHNLEKAEHIFVFHSAMKIHF